MWLRQIAPVPLVGQCLIVLTVFQGRTAGARRKLSLGTIKAESDSIYVFPSARTSRPYPATLVARHLKNNREFLKVPENFSTHGLRHTSMTQLASMGCGKELRDRLSNHRDSSVDSLCQHYEHDKEAGEWWQVARPPITGLSGRPFLVMDEQPITMKNDNSPGPMKWNGLSPPGMP